MDVNALARQVLDNCTISDAKHAGIYSICGLAMRLRDLFKWQHALAPWIEKDASQVLEWIGRQEELWESLTDEPYRQIRIGRQSYDPFETEPINRLLQGEDLFYGAGYAHSMKPSFLLADILSRQTVEGHEVLLLGREHARDLLTLPAFTQDRKVIIRREAARMYLWDQILYLRESKRPALRFAIEALGIAEPCKDRLHEHLDTLLERYQSILLHHEIGELTDAHFPLDIWRDMISTYPHSPVELLARTLKDLLADTGTRGTLAHIMQTRDSAALGLYTAFRDGLCETLFPELDSCFDAFSRGTDWTLIARAAEKGHEKARRYSRQTIAFYQNPRNRDDPQWAAERIVKTMVQRGLILTKS